MTDSQLPIRRNRAAILPRLLRRLTDDPYLVLLLGAMGIYLWIFTSLAFEMHAGMRTHRADLGNMVHAIWNSSRGYWLQSMHGNEMSVRLTDHVEPIFVLISPILWIWRDARALLFLQTLAATLGALPLYALAGRLSTRLLSSRQRRQIWLRDPLQALTRPIALALALAYLLNPQLQSALLTEFHAIPLSVPLILWAFWSIEAERRIQFVVATLLVVMVKEEAALLGAGLGVWAGWRWFRLDRADGVPASRWRRSLPFPALVTIISLAWFYVATFVIVPAYAAEAYDFSESGYFRRYGALGNSAGDIFRSFFTQPALVWQIATEPVRLDYLRDLLASFGFLSLLAPEVLLLALPIQLANQLSAYPAQYYGEFHYSAPLVPYFAVSAAFGAFRLWTLLSRIAGSSSGSFQHMPAAGAGTMALVSFFKNSSSAVRPLLTLALSLWLLGSAALMYVDRGRGPLGGRYDPTPQTAHHQLLQRFVDQIPANAAVTATAAVHPHVATRRYVYQFPLGLEPPGRAEWALLDVTTNTDMAPGDLYARVQELLASGWGVVDGADGFLLLHQGEENRAIPDEFYSFVRLNEEAHTDCPEGESCEPLFDWGPISLIGHSLEDWPRWRQTKITTVWHVGGEEGSPRASPQLEVRSPDGELIYSIEGQSPPGLVWYPPDRWQPGDRIRITTEWLFLPDVWGVVAGAVGTGANGGQQGLRLLEGDAAVETGGEKALVSVSVRNGEGRLVKLPAPTEAYPPALTMTQIWELLLEQREVDIRTESGEIELSGWIGEQSRPAGTTVDLWLRWRGEETLTAGTPFVHLRKEGQNVAQQDGPPRFFVMEPAGSIIDDWRRLPIPTGVEGPLEVVVGYYDPVTFERMRILRAGEPIGDELSLGFIELGAAPQPDQACALIPMSCASQP